MNKQASYYIPSYKRSQVKSNTVITIEEIYKLAKIIFYASLS